MNKKLSILLSILIIVLITVSAYGWMQTEPSRGQLVEYNRNFYITDSDIEVRLFSLIGNTYVEQGQQQTDAALVLSEMYPGKIQRYRFVLTNNNPVMARVKVVFTDLTGDVSLISHYLKVNGTNPDVFSFLMNDKLEYNETDSRYFFDFIDSISIPANSSINYYWNLEADIKTPNSVQGKTLSVGKIMFIKPN